MEQYKLGLNLSLKSILSDIVEQKQPFFYRGPANPVFSQYSEVFQAWMLKAERYYICGNFLLAENDVIPMASSWQLRFHPELQITEEESCIFYGKRFYCLSWSANKHILSIEEKSDRFEVEQNRFFSDWKTAEDNLPEFIDLKTNQVFLDPDEYCRKVWYPDETALALVRTTDSPVYFLDLKQVEKNYLYFTQLFPNYSVYYSVKTNPDPEILKCLWQLGCRFEAVSYDEVKLALDAGANIDRIIFSAPVKRVQDIQDAYKRGIRIFVADCTMEVDKLARHAPGCYLLLRLKTSDHGARVKLSSKYGLEIGQTLNLFRYAKNQGLIPYGLTFHVGGQNILCDSWIKMQNHVHHIFAEAQTEGIVLHLVNIGGGFPIKLDVHSPDLSDISKTLANTQKADLSYCAEPGRVIVGDAGLLVCPVITVTERWNGTWLYVDASIFGSLFMMGLHAFEYPITTDHIHLEVKSYHLASLSCDGRDIICYNVVLPVGIQAGHLLFFHLVGGYSLPVFDISYAGVSKTKICYLK